MTLAPYFVVHCNIAAFAISFINEVHHAANFSCLTFFSTNKDS